MASMLDLFAPTAAPLVRVSEFVWVDCPKCGGSLECAGIRDVIEHVYWCDVAAPVRC